jgi:hypothetical protein
MKTISYIVVVVDVMNVKKKKLSRESENQLPVFWKIFSTLKKILKICSGFYFKYRESQSRVECEKVFFLLLCSCVHFIAIFFFLNFGMSWDFGQKQTMRWHKKVSHQNQIKIHTKLIAQFKAHHTHIHTILTIHNSLSFDLFSYIKNSFFPLHTFIFMIND